MTANTLNVAPDTAGLIRWARKVLAEAPDGSEDARVAREVLAECGVTDLD
ncbi:hypothetical protein [Mycobacteroides abscessus]|nr:hypothetical protein [Mycobacteroides abscessus]SKW05476.1 Uncharacterised protein [Mycobacteroides abscessus subsp. abscessus]